MQQDFPDFSAEWVIPDECSSVGAILYLHGGGYTCGGLEYARRFGSKLASEYGLKVFCCAYRLAPENKFPAVLDDALASYKYLIDSGFPSSRIILVGESAGGGLCYSLCLKLNELGFSQPAGIIAISPWMDLTSSGDSIETNKEVDPTLTIGQLNFYADSYTEDRTNPYVSPLFFDEGTKLPPSLIFVGSDEILLDDSTRLHQKLLNSGNRSKLNIANRMWHAYVLYDVKERKTDYDTIKDFVGELIPITTARGVALTTQQRFSQHPNPVIFTPTAFVSIILYLLYIDLTVHGGWFLSLAFPIAGIAGIIVTTVVTLLRYVKRGYLFIIGGALIATGGYVALIEMFISITFESGSFVGWSGFPLAALFVLGMMLIIIGICKPLRLALSKIFFV